MIEEKKVKCPITIYFPEDIKKKVEQRSVILGRSQTEEVIYLVRLGLAISKDADARALELLMKHQPTDIE